MYIQSESNEGYVTLEFRMHSKAHKNLKKLSNTFVKSDIEKWTVHTSVAKKRPHINQVVILQSDHLILISQIKLQITM